MNSIPYTDLNIPIGPNCKRVCETAIQYGYKILAINTPVLARESANPPNGGGGGKGKKAGKKRKWEERSGGIVASTAASQIGISAPVVQDWEAQLMNENPGVKILKRLTIIFTEIGELQRALSQPHVKLYDLLGVIPTTTDALQACIITTTLIFDIISFDLEGPHWIKSIRMNKLKGDLAARREIFFEVTYASSMHGDDALENMVYLANRLTEDICVKRVKNMIISSGAASFLELRAPKDAASLAYLLGLDETTARQCMREHAHRILNKTDGRKYGKTWVAFIPGTTKEEGESCPVTHGSISTK